MASRIACGLLVFQATGGALAAQSDAFHWPTPNRAFAERQPYEALVQPTVSGRTVSGLFGCVRSDGRQFHEGIDLRALNRDRRGEATDEVSSIRPGVVVYANGNAGWSDFGRYVVVEHPDESLGVISLYGHLASLARNAVAGTHVDAGQVLGVMGRSAAGYTIPRDRAHLHLEVGVLLSRKFQSWYDAQRYSSRNRHGVFNGFNLVGLDFLDFAERQRAGEVADLREYVARLPVAVSVVVADEMIPDFVERYPALLAAAPEGDHAGWQVDFTWFGLPKHWRSLSRGELAGASEGGPTIVFHDATLLERYPCQSVVQMRGGTPLPGPKLRQILGILFAGGS